MPGGGLEHPKRTEGRQPERHICLLQAQRDLPHYSALTPPANAVGLR